MADSLQSLREGEPGPLYLIYGKERYTLACVA